LQPGHRQAEHCGLLVFFLQQLVSVEHWAAEARWQHQSSSAPALRLGRVGAEHEIRQSQALSPSPPPIHARALHARRATTRCRLYIRRHTGGALRLEPHAGGQPSPVAGWTPGPRPMGLRCAEADPGPGLSPARPLFAARVRPPTCCSLPPIPRAPRAPLPALPAARVPPRGSLFHLLHIP